MFLALRNSAANTATSILKYSVPSAELLELVGEIHLREEERECAPGRNPRYTHSRETNTAGPQLEPVGELTVVFMMPVPWVRMELAM
ncbi:hypothetical protein EYF80_029958 [Liparis tanakae]|uniref:Uncharacterized protein n=1 Tax=Liparis tanakae TaxID=230148 RepID=A0A4Z2H3U9_9TELE|nr:hypothetical protein EYF80_029958 [Liparis tanakae]